MVDAAFAAETDATAHTFVGELDDAVVVDGPDGHHLARVRRLEVGERVTAADGTGMWRGYDVVAVADGRVELRASDPPRREPVLTPALRVAFALTKGTKPEVVVRQLTELGVDAVIPVIAKRSVVKMRGDRARELTERLARVAREAAGQSRRARVTEVAAPVPLGELETTEGLVVADRDGDAAALEAPGPGGWTLLVGPEGGFDPAELEAIAGAPRLAVGPHVLRAETAAVAGAALLTSRRAPTVG